jgi:hypothetical protein
MNRVAHAGLAAAILALLVILIFEGYNEPWTGFGAVRTAPDGIAAKTLWDWLDLLVVPLFLALAAYFLDRSRKRSEQLVETDRQRQSVLDGYIESMKELLLERGLMDSESDAVRMVARTRTLAALRLLDGSRKAQLLQFIYEMGLIDASPILDLNGADLSGAVLDECTLQACEIRGAYFYSASFRNANLQHADLRGSDFLRADFTGANLNGANLIQASLQSARIVGTRLTEAELGEADLSGITPRSVRKDLERQQLGRRQ